MTAHGTELDAPGPDSASHALAHGIIPQASGHPFWALELFFAFTLSPETLIPFYPKGGANGVFGRRHLLDRIYAEEIDGARADRVFWSPELPEVSQVTVKRLSSVIDTFCWFPCGGNVGLRTLRLLSAFLLLLCLALPAGAQTLRGPARVVDGDTLEMAGEKVRLHGIDAPELAQTCQRTSGAVWHCGWVAAVRLEEMIGGRPVRCLGAERDRYKRLIARCYVVGERGPALDLGGALVVQGLALSYRKYSADYNSAESAAKAARTGMWAGSFVQPEEWRRGGGR